MNTGQCTGAEAQLIQHISPLLVQGRGPQWRSVEGACDRLRTKGKADIANGTMFGGSNLRLFFVQLRGACRTFQITLKLTPLGERCFFASLMGKN